MDASTFDTREPAADTPSRPPDPFEGISDDELAQRLRAAQDAADGLLARAAEAEKLALAAGEAFRSQPSSATHTDAAVSAQQAQNAREAERANATEWSAVSSEIRRRAMLQRANELIPLADRDALYDRWCNQVVALVAQLHDRMEQEGQRMVAELKARDAAAQELAPLAKDLCLYEYFDKPLRTSHRDAGERLYNRLARVFGSAPLGPFRLVVRSDESGSDSVQISAYKRFNQPTQEDTSQ